MAYACAEDTQSSSDRQIAQHDVVTYDLTATVERREGPAKPGHGRPRRRPEPALAAAVHWRVRYATTLVENGITA
jgi:hypothetical protein